MKIGILLLLFYLNLSNAVAGDLLKYQEFLDMGIKGARSAYNPYLYLPKKQFEAQRQKNYDLFVQDIQSLQAIFGGDILEHLPQKGFHLIALDDAPEMQKVISQILKDLLKTKVGSQICFYQTFRVPEVIQEKFGLLAADAFEVAQDCGRELEEEMFKTSGIKLSQSTEFGGLTRTPLTNFYFVFLPEGEPAPYDSWTGYEEKDLFQNAYTFIYIDAKTFSKDYLYRVFAHELEMRTDKRHFTTVVLEKFLKIRDKDFLCHAYSLLYQPLVRLGLSTIRAFKAELSMLTELGRQSAVDFHDLMNLSCTDRVKASIKMVSNFQPLLGAEAQAYQYAFSTVC